MPGGFRGMQFLAITRRRTESFSAEEFDAVLEPEAERVRELYAAGSFHQVYSRGDIPGGVMLIEARDAAEADKLMASLPLAQKGMSEVEIVALRPYRGFGPRST